MTRRGELKVVIKQGRSLDPTRKFYPFWKLKCIGPKGEKSDVAAKYEELKEKLIQILMHELTVDRITGRRPDFQKYRKFLKELSEEKLIKEAQTRLEDFEISHPVYTKFVGYDYEVEFEEILEDARRKRGRSK